MKKAPIYCRNCLTNRIATIYRSLIFVETIVQRRNYGFLQGMLVALVLEYEYVLQQ